MAKKSPKRKAKKSTASAGRHFSMKALHTELDRTLGRLRKKKASKKRDELIDLVKGLRANTFCGQNMLIALA
jgi:hypothetical protein